MSILGCAHTASQKQTPPAQSLANSASINTQAAYMVPEWDEKSGAIYGFKFIVIEPDSIYEKMGFEVQDVIVSVNDKPVTEARNAMEFYQSLKEGEPLEVSILRDGRELLIPLHQ